MDDMPYVESHLWLWSSAVDQPGDVLQRASLQHLDELFVEVKPVLSLRGGNWL